MQVLLSYEVERLVSLKQALSITINILSSNSKPLVRVKFRYLSSINLSASKCGREMNQTSQSAWYVQLHWELRCHKDLRTAIKVKQSGTLSSQLKLQPSRNLGLSKAL